MEKIEYQTVYLLLNLEGYLKQEPSYMLRRETIFIFVEKLLWSHLMGLPQRVYGESKSHSNQSSANP